MKKFNFLLNEDTGEIFPASEFFFYPLTLNDYLDVYRTPSNSSYPIMAFIYLTHRCNDRCNGCFARSIEDGTANIDLSTLNKLLHSLRLGGTKAIKLAGREPTVYPYLSECLDLCAKLDLKTLLITSGTNIDKHADSISKNCSHLRVSLNTINEESHNSLHHPTKEALPFSMRIFWLEKILKERRKHKLISGATFLVRRETIDYAIDYARMCKELGFNYVRYTVLDDSKGNYPTEWKSVNYKLLALENDYFKVCIHNSLPNSVMKLNLDSIDKRLVDPAILSRVTIHANGKVASCHEGWRATWPKDNMATYGSLNESSFDDIWKGNKRKEFLEYIQSNLHGVLEKPKCCTSCKYDNFNTVQHWLILQLAKNPNVKISTIIVDMPWDTLTNSIT